MGLQANFDRQSALDAGLDIRRFDDGRYGVRIPHTETFMQDYGADSPSVCVDCKNIMVRKPLVEWLSDHGIPVTLA